MIITTLLNYEIRYPLPTKFDEARADGIEELEEAILAVQH
jgi:hypothetical protein